jgi:integrase
MPKKRGHGEGSIIERKTGARKFQAYFSLGDGKRISKCFYTRKEAREWLGKMRRKKEDGINLEMRNVSLEEFLVHWLENIAKPSLRVPSYECYARMVKLHITPRLGKAKFGDLKPQHLQSLYGTLQDKPSAVSVIHGVMHQVLSWAIRLGLVSRNVADIARPPRYRPKSMKVLSESEVERLLVSAREADDPFYPLWLLAVTTGMRRGEIAGLHWEDVDFARGTISVRHTLQTTDSGLVLQEPKTAKGKRLVAISSLVAQTLREHYQREEQKRKIYPDSLALKLVFTNPRGELLHPGTIDYLFRRALARASLPRVRFHDLRHTSATLLLKHGIHPKIVQERLGHANISMTLDTYSHVVPGLQEEAALKIEGSLSKGLLNDCA